MYTCSINECFDFQEPYEMYNKVDNKRVIIEISLIDKEMRE